MNDCQTALERLRRVLFEVRFAGLVAEIVEAIASDGWLLAVQLLEAALVTIDFRVEQRATVRTLIRCLESLIRRNPTVACATTHKTSTIVQGPGKCCAAYAAAGFTTPAIGQRVVAVNSAGKCIVCEVKASTSPKHPGLLVFKRGKSVVPGSNVSCPSTAEGCCALLGQ